MKTPLRTTAIVLKSIEHGESDKIVTFLSRDCGRLTCIAKGGMRSLKRFCNKLEPFSLLEVDFVPATGSGLARIDQAELIDSFPSLRSDIRRYCAACLGLELSLFWARENDSDHSFFQLLAWTLARLNDTDSPAPLIALFALRLYSLQGYRPVLDVCIACSTKTTPQQNFFFDPRRHGIVCDHCRRDTKLTPLGLGTLRLLDQALSMDLERTIRLRFSPASLMETWNLAESYGNILLQRDIIAWNQARKHLFPRRTK